MPTSTLPSWLNPGSEILLKTAARTKNAIPRPTYGAFTEATPPPLPIGRDLNDRHPGTKHDQRAEKQGIEPGFCRGIEQQAANPRHHKPQHQPVLVANLVDRITLGR